MWPTFFLSALAYGDPFIDGAPSIACGLLSLVNTTPQTVPNPDTLEDGDTQLVLITFFQTGSVNWPAGWRLAFDSSRCALPVGANYGIGYPQVAWVRKYSAGDPDFTISNASGVGWYLYASIALKNAESSDPWMNALWNAAGASVYGRGSPEGPMQYLEVANEGDLVIQTTSPSVGLTVDNNPSASDVEFACAGEISVSGTPRTGHSMSGFSARRRANNLLTYSHDLDPAGWTMMGVARDPLASYSVDSKGYVKVYPTTANSKHYFEQEVTLEAGKTYRFSVAYCGNTAGAPSSYIWLSYIKPDTSEHGAGCDAPGSALANMTGSTEVDWNTPGSAWRTLEVGTSLGAYGAIISIKIAADVSGTYKLRLYVTDGTQPATAYVGNTTCWLQIAGTSLAEGPAENAMAVFLPTTSSPITPGSVPYVLPTPPIIDPTDGNETFATGYCNFIMRRSGGTRPVCKLFNQVHRNVNFEFDDYEIVDSRWRHAPEAETPVALRASHVVYDLLVDKKFYFELEVDSWGTGSVDDCYTIGAAPFEAVNVMMGNTGTHTATGDYAGQFAWTATGKTYTNGALDGTTISAWTLGDFIGCGIDFTNWEITFYLNGTLVKTMSIPSGYLRDAFWTALLGFYADYSADKQARMTYNFRGPFGGRKPSGFVAFDFDNELA